MSIISSYLRILLIPLLVLSSFVLFFHINGESAASGSIISIVQAPIAQERRIHNITPRRIPVTITETRNVGNEQWLRDLEIEIRNDSNRPIYYLNMILKFPDITTTREDGIERIFIIPLTYGNRELMQPGRFATTNDIPIRPNQKHVFRIPKLYREGLEAELSERNLPPSVTKRIMVKASSLSFGDGTGFMSGAPFSNKQSSTIYSLPEIKLSVKSAFALISDNKKDLALSLWVNTTSAQILKAISPIS